MALEIPVHIGLELQPLTKRITQQKIDLFEQCGVIHGSNIHTDPQLAARRLGTTYTIASGRMSIAYACQALRSVLGGAFDRTGTLNMKFLRPVRDGDTVTVGGQVTEMRAEGDGTRVVVDVWCENQDSHRTAVGMGSALLPGVPVEKAGDAG